MSHATSSVREQAELEVIVVSANLSVLDDLAVHQSFRFDRQARTTGQSEENLFPSLFGVWIQRKVQRQGHSLEGVRRKRAWLPLGWATQQLGKFPPGKHAKRNIAHLDSSSDAVLSFVGIAAHF